LGWPPNPDPGIAGYNVYSGTVSGAYAKVTDVGNVTNAVINNLQEGQTYYFVVTAYDILGLESLPSPEMVYAVPSTNTVKFNSNFVTIQPKGQLMVSLSGPVGATAVLLSSTNMATWNPIATNVFMTNNLFIKVMDTPGANKARFFRVKLQ
jgi:hypothetical protein